MVNYDAFEISEDLLDDYSAMVKYLTERYCSHVSRYTTSAIMRMKLGDALENRGVSSHIFDTQREAVNFARALDARKQAR